ncbi:3-oxoadipate enol-lactonase [Umezawaea beigongshangensis]|uniref:3-oxoadipate enol-lactonase n=1 Tax=Umezawaea beigongshangensis TaxID=2780383 RepID=UPI0018F1D5B7|nr:3-oxoadipate enol-lactonase [Umezawaea beigongshangensis]
MTVVPHHLVEGPPDGDVVVLSGSLGSDLRTWDAQVGPLVTAGFRVVRHDHRGHGHSPVPPGPYSLADLGGDVLALLDRVGARRVHWVGLSLGGMVGTWLAQHAPERLRGLVLLCTSARLGPPESWAERAALVRARGTGAVAAAVVGRWLTPGFALAHPEVPAELIAMVAGTSAEGYASCCAAIGDADLEPGLPGITAPTLLVAGAQDPATPPPHLERIAAAVPGARLEVLDPGAHLVTAEQPERTSRLIVDHLRSVA